jgi:tetratricopeptide (TPR) repeat protein
VGAIDGSPRAPGPRTRAQAHALYRRALDLSPEDVEILRAQADLFAESGNREEQLKSLRQILALRPQEKTSGNTSSNIEPPKPRVDEQYAWAAERFLEKRKLSAGGHNRRTLRIGRSPRCTKTGSHRASVKSSSNR